MGMLDEIDTPGIDHDQLGALAQTLQQPRGEDGMAVGRIGAHHHHHIGLGDGIEILRAGRSSQRRA